MSHRKTVTEGTLVANRLNAKRSTGPRTERGKKASKFNAVITVHFAKHVVIPICGGEGTEKQFARLLADLQQEFQPEGRLEEFYIGEMAKSMWRLRRATCAEKGSVRQRKPPDVYLYLKAKPILDTIFIVQSAQKELKTTGTLSPATYTAVLPVIEKIQACVAQPEDGDSPAEPKIDDQFLPLLERQRELLEMALKERHRMTDEEVEDSYPTHALPPDSVMNDILRYETAAQKKFDWALQKLSESQERRRKAQEPVSV
jgi:hypothetical protein